MQRGFISVYRKLQDHEFWREHREFSKLEAWLYLLLNANHCPNSFTIGNHIFHLKRGQLMRSLGHLAHDFGWGIKRVRLFLTLCQEMKMIELKSGTVATQITICNYDTYQYSGQEEDTLGAHLGHDQGTLRATNKELKNVRKKEETPLPPKKTGCRGKRVEYAPDTGPDGLPQIGEERSVLYKGIAHAWWVAHKAGRGEYPTWTKWTNSGIEELERLGKPIEDYRSVFSYSFKDDFWKNAASYESVYKNWDALYAKSKSSQQPQDKPIDLLKQIAEDRRRNEINDNEGY